jgi:hypothetical protein
MVTFSSGTTVANQLPGLINIVQVLPDNTAKVITPKNFRDSVFTLWENSMFKPTTVSESNIYYVGIDQFTERKSIMFTTWENCLLRGGIDGYGKGVLNGCMEA